MRLRWGLAPLSRKGPRVRAERRQRRVRSPCFLASSRDMQSAADASAGLFLNEPLWKARSRFSFSLWLLYIWGCLMSASCLIHCES